MHLSLTIYIMHKINTVQWKTNMFEIVRGVRQPYITHVFHERFVKGKCMIFFIGIYSTRWCFTLFLNCFNFFLSIFLILIFSLTVLFLWFVVSILFYIILCIIFVSICIIIKWFHVFSMSFMWGMWIWLSCIKCVLQIKFFYH